MPGRRWSDGLHQAVEAKEGVQIERETQTLATITIQNYFRLYEKLARHDRHRGDRGERVPRHLQARRRGDPDQPPVRRVDRNDLIYKTQREKYNAVIKRDPGGATPRPARAGRHGQRRDVARCSAACCKREKIPHNVLNAKYHQQEAEIVARAGQPGAVTIATNMAGRGTDIKLGDGRRPTSAACYVIGTERHESRRIDRQLRGRCARQGDPGVLALLRQLRGRSDAQLRRVRPHDARSWSASASRKARNSSIRG